MGHDLLHEVTRPVEDVIIINPYLGNITPEVIADRPDDDFAFLVNEKRAGLFLGGRLDGIPEHIQVFQVPLQFFSVFTHTGGAQYQAHALGYFKSAHRLTGITAVVALNLPGNTPCPGIVRHENQVTPGKADERGQRRSLVAALFLFHLDDVFLPHLQCILDAYTAAVIVTVPGFQQGAGYFLEGEEAVPFGAEIDESRFKTGFYPDYPAFIDIRLFLFPACCLDIKIIQALAIH